MIKRNSDFIAEKKPSSINLPNQLLYLTVTIYVSLAFSIILVCILLKYPVHYAAVLESNAVENGQQNMLNLKILGTDQLSIREDIIIIDSFGQQHSVEVLESSDKHIYKIKSEKLFSLGQNVQHFRVTIKVRKSLILLLMKQANPMPN